MRIGWLPILKSMDRFPLRVTRIWRRLLNSPAAHYESPVLELSRGWAFPNSSGDSLVVEDKKTPFFLFLIETKAKIGKLERLRCFLGFEGLFHVDSIGRSGGLAFLWNDNKEVEIVNYSQRHVSALITLMNEGQS